jgi:hypothetical protein
MSDCRAAAAVLPSEPISMSRISHEYVRLVLALGRHDADYVDAYYGPAGIKAEAEAAKQEFERLLSSPRLPSGLL